MRTRSLITKNTWARWATILVLGAAAQVAADGKTLGLQECLDAGLQGNFDLKRLEEGTLLTESRIEEAKSNYLPTLKASGSVTNMWDKPYSQAYQMEVGNRWTVGAGLTLSQPIYVQQAITGIRIARKGRELDKLGKDAQRDGVIQQIATLYWTAAYLEENGVVLDSSRANLVRVRATVEALVQQGVAKQSDLNSMDISIASLDASRDNLRDQAVASKFSLQQAMGMAPDSSLRLSDRLDKGVAAAGAVPTGSVQSTTSVKLLETQIDLQEMQENLATDSRFPTVVAFAKYSTEGTSENFDFQKNTTDKFTDTGVLGIQVDFPIFDGMSSSIAKTQARIQKRQLQLDLEKKKLALQADSANAMRALEFARAQVERQRNTIALGERNFALKDMEYQQQVASLSDLLQAQSSVISARAGLLEALYNEKTAELELKQVLGIMSREVAQ